MKKILLLLTLMTLILSACGSEMSSVDEELDSDMVATVVAEMMAATAAAQTNIESQAPAPTEAPAEAVPIPTLSTDFENAAPIQSQLIIGIYRLENTALAITKEQANVLYTQLLSLQTSMTNQTLSGEEINSLVLQQVAALSAEQIQAIIDLQITQEIVMATMQQLGFETGGRGGGEDSGQRGGGVGTPPTDGSGQPPQQGGGGGQTGIAPEGEEVRNNLIPPELIDAIITLLESKING